MPVDKKKLHDKKLKPGQGWLQNVAKKVTPHTPDFRGVIRLDRDYVKGRKLYISAWVRKFPANTYILLDIANAKEMAKKWEEWRKKAKERDAKIRHAAEVREARARAELFEVKRKDVL
jgi:hypothetical protein